jgi:hypothetical protein
MAQPQVRAMEQAAPPLCRWCGHPIAKRTTRVHIVPVLGPNHRDSMFWRYVAVGDNWPKTKADCQKLTNHTVVRVGYTTLYDDNGEPAGKRLTEFGEWDGESYQNKYFCNGEHAKEMGNAAAAKGWSTIQYREARTKGV